MADAKKTEGEAEVAVPKKRGKMMIFIIIGVVVLVLIGGGAAFMLMKKKPVTDEDGEEISAKEEKAKKKEKKDHSAPPAFYKFDKPFTVKLQTEQQEAYLQVEVQLRVVDAQAAESVKQYEPEIKHRVTLILLGKKASELVVATGVEKLSTEIRDAVNGILEPSATAKKSKPKKDGEAEAEAGAPVQAVLFTSFIIQ